MLVLCPLIAHADGEVRWTQLRGTVQADNQVGSGAGQVTGAVVVRLGPGKALLERPQDLDNARVMLGLPTYLVVSPPRDI